MGVIVYVCPVTGEEVQTGIETTEEGFEQVGGAWVEIECPKCGQRHPWTSINARLEEGPPPLD